MDCIANNVIALPLHVHIHYKMITCDVHSV